MIGGVLLVVRAIYDDVGVVVPIGLALMFAAAVGFVIRTVYRTATIADEAHLTIVGLTGTRQIAWRDVQGIEIELRRTRPPIQVAVVYDAAGDKRDLPHVNEHSLVTALWPAARISPNALAQREKIQNLWPRCVDKEAAAPREALRGTGGATRSGPFSGHGPPAPRRGQGADCDASPRAYRNLDRGTPRAHLPTQSTSRTGTGARHPPTCRGRR